MQPIPLTDGVPVRDQPVGLQTEFFHPIATVFSQAILQKAVSLMAFVEKGLSSAAAFCIGGISLAVAPVPGAMEASVGAVGMIAYGLGLKERHGPECDKVLAGIRRRIRRDYAAYIESEGENWRVADELAQADEALATHLPGCFVDRHALADLAVDAEGFAGNVSAMALAELAQRDAGLFGAGAANDLPRRYAADVITAGMAAARENRDYWKKLELPLTLAIAKGVGEIRDDVRGLDRKIEEQASAASSRHDELMERIARLEAKAGGAEAVADLNSQTLGASDADFRGLLEIVLEKQVAAAGCCSVACEVIAG